VVLLSVQKILKKIQTICATYAQVLAVWLGFALMVFLSYYFMSGIEARHLSQHINDFLSIATTRIESEALETEITLRNLSLVLRRMILDGAGPDMALDYMTEVTKSVLPYEKHIMETTGIFGYFNAFGGLYLNGLGWEPPDDYVPEDRPWHIAAVAANGNIANTELYKDMDTKQTVTTYAQQFFDDEGRPLGIICLNISLDNIANYIISTKIAGSGYGMLLDKNRIMVVHPNPDYVGRGLYEVRGTDDILNDLDHEKTIVSERKLKNYEGVQAITFFHKLNNGWYLGIVIPENKYYQSLNIIALILIFLGALLAGVLSFILLQIIMDRQKANERVHVMLEEVETSAHWYKSILDAVPLPITVTDANTNWTFVNTQVENFLGVKFGDIMGKPCSNWGAHICNTPNCGIECAKRGLKHTYFSHNGSSYKVDVEILKDISGETAGYIEVVQDITQLEEMAKRQMEAETVSKAKSAFIATISHEIRTPLNAILGITDIQIQDHTILQTTRDALIKIHNSGDLLLHIINDILDMSKIEAGRMELQPVSYDVPSLINDTVHINMVRINNKPIKFELNVSENIPSEMFGDELRIKQILNNLLSNAFKYTEQGTVSLSVDSEWESREKNRVTLIFEVSDTGLGMKPEEISNLFSEYSRFHMEANRTTEGTGLGMSITKHLVYLMNGEIHVKSEPGKGSVFTVRLPQRSVSSAVLGRELAENLRHFRFNSSPLLRKAQITREPMPYGKVLIVDDVETNLYVASGLLAPYDLKVELVTSGYEAIEKITNGNVYDIIFMDHMMPKMDGIEATKIIRETGYAHPIVALTANAVVGQAEIFLKSGFDDFVSKPIDIRQLNILLNRLIRDKQPPEIIEKARREKSEQGEGASLQLSVNSELTKIFARDAEKAISALETVMQNNFRETDMQTFIINVHAMKSALANIGEAELSAAAQKLEQAGREDETGVIKSETPAFLNNLRIIIDKYKSDDEGNETGEDTEEALVFLREKLLDIKEACIVYDKRAAKKALKELKEKTWSHNTTELLDKIAEHLLHSEFYSVTVLVDENVKDLKMPAAQSAAQL
jgi:PAS domain S-box-containing protein